MAAGGTIKFKGLDGGISLDASPELTGGASLDAVNVDFPGDGIVQPRKGNRPYGLYGPPAPKPSSTGSTPPNGTYYYVQVAFDEATGVCLMGQTSAPVTATSQMISVTGLEPGKFLFRTKAGGRDFYLHPGAKPFDGDAGATFTDGTPDDDLIPLIGKTFTGSVINSGVTGTYYYLQGEWETGTIGAPGTPSIKVFNPGVVANTGVVAGVVIQVEDINVADSYSGLLLRKPDSAGTANAWGCLNGTTLGPNTVQYLDNDDTLWPHEACLFRASEVTGSDAGGTLPAATYQFAIADVWMSGDTTKNPHFTELDPVTIGGAGTGSVHFRFDGPVGRLVSLYVYDVGTAVYRYITKLPVVATDGVEYDFTTYPAAGSPPTVLQLTPVDAANPRPVSGDYRYVYFRGFGNDPVLPRSCGTTATLTVDGTLGEYIKINTTADEKGGKYLHRTMDIVAPGDAWQFYPHPDGDPLVTSTLDDEQLDGALGAQDATLPVATVMTNPNSEGLTGSYKYLMVETRYNERNVIAIGDESDVVTVNGQTILVEGLILGNDLYRAHYDQVTGEWGDFYLHTQGLLTTSIYDSTPDSALTTVLPADTHINPMGNVHWDNTAIVRGLRPWVDRLGLRRALALVENGCVLPVITIQPVSKVGVNADGTVSFSVEATGSNLEFQWYFNGVALEGETDGQQTQSGTWHSTLTIEEVAAGDAGEYYCVITSADCGETTSATVQLSLAGAPGDCILPEIVTQPQSVTASEGDTVSVSVRVTGDPPITYQWQFSDDNGDTWVDIDGATNWFYTISNVTESTVGHYRCIVTSPCGTVFSLAARVAMGGGIPVCSEPTIWIEDAAPCHGESFSITAFYTGTGPVTVSLSGPGGSSSTTSETSPGSITVSGSSWSAAWDVVGWSATAYNDCGSASDSRTIAGKNCTPCIDGLSACGAVDVDGAGAYLIYNNSPAGIPGKTLLDTDLMLSVCPYLPPDSCDGFPPTCDNDAVAFCTYRWEVHFVNSQGGSGGSVTVLGTARTQHYTLPAGAHYPRPWRIVCYIEYDDGTSSCNTTFIFGVGYPQSGGGTVPSPLWVGITEPTDVPTSTDIAAVNLYQRRTDLSKRWSPVGSAFNLAKHWGWDISRCHQDRPQPNRGAVFIAPGTTDAPVYWDGEDEWTRLSQPTAPTLITFDGVGAKASTYIYIFIARNSRTGICSELSTSYTVPSDEITGGGDVDITFPAGEITDDRWIDVYRSAVGSTGTPRFVATLKPADLSGAVWLDGVADDARALDLVTEAVMGAPPASIDVRFYANRAWWLTSDSRVFYSDSGLYYPNVAPASYVEVDRDIGASPKRLDIVGDRLHLFTDKGIYPLEGGDPSTFRFAPIITSESSGCIAPRTEVPFRDGVFYLGRSGPVVFRPGGEISPVGGPVEPWFHPRQLGDSLATTSEKADFTNRVDFVWRNATSTERQIIWQLRFLGKDSDVVGFCSSRFTGEDGLTWANDVTTTNLWKTVAGSESVHLSVDPTLFSSITFRPGFLYDVHFRTIEYDNGSILGDWVSLGTYRNEWPLRGDSFDTNAALDAHAFDYYPRSQMWLFCRSNISTRPDVAWVWHYGKSIANPNAPMVWTRHLMQGGAGCVLPGINPNKGTNDESFDSQVPNGRGDWGIVGDCNGLIWLLDVPGACDHDNAAGFGKLDVSVKRGGYYHIPGTINDIRGIALEETGRDSTTPNEDFEGGVNNTLLDSGILDHAFAGDPFPNNGWWLAGSHVTVRDQQNRIYTGVVGHSPTYIKYAFNTDTFIPPGLVLRPATGLVPTFTHGKLVFSAIDIVPNYVSGYGTQADTALMASFRTGEGTPGAAMLFFRFQDHDNSYWLELDNTGLYLWGKVNKIAITLTRTLLNSAVTLGSSWSDLMLRAVGTELVVWLNGDVVYSSPTILATAHNVTWTNWAVGAQWSGAQDARVEVREVKHFATRFVPVIYWIESREPPNIYGPVAYYYQGGNLEVALCGQRSGIISGWDAGGADGLGKRSHTVRVLTDSPTDIMRCIGRATDEAGVLNMANEKNWRSVAVDLRCGGRNTRTALPMRLMGQYLSVEAQSMHGGAKWRLHGVDLDANLTGNVKSWPKGRSRTEG